MKIITYKCDACGTMDGDCKTYIMPIRFQPRATTEDSDSIIKKEIELCSSCLDKFTRRLLDEIFNSSNKVIKITCDEYQIYIKDNTINKILKDIKINKDKENE